MSILNKEEFRKELKGRILLLDGAFGSLVQNLNLQEDDFKNPITKRNDTALNEILNLTRKDVVSDIHRQYIEAGCDIIETNTFCANNFVLEEYGLENSIEEINLAACQCAKDARGDRDDIYIAGVLGPTKETLAFSTVVDNPTFRNHDFDDFEEMYYQQATFLDKGGVDLFLIETAFDTLVIKSAVKACIKANADIPIMVSCTFSDSSRRMLCGQNLEALALSLSSYPIDSLGLNCSMGPRGMESLVTELSSLTEFPVSTHPNAGLPNLEGKYVVEAEEFATLVEPWLEKGLINIIGGCCGTTPAHIKKLSTLVKKYEPRAIKLKQKRFELASLETIKQEENKIIVVGERTNVAGSMKFARLVKEESWDEALSIARKEVEQGASILDICMDAPLLDARKSMVTFLRMIASDPSVSKIPVMIDSSDFSVIEEALKEIQGKCIINSISLKEGESEFLRRARLIKSFGHSMIVMLFDEEGQATNYQRRIEIAKRSYDLLMKENINPTDIVFDPNVLSIATGIEEHDTYAYDFIRATKWIKDNLKGSLVSGGISNLSFSFRGNNEIRKKMHTIFMNVSGLDMGIINPTLPLDSSYIPKEQYDIIKESFLLENGDNEKAREDLINLATSIQELKNTSVKKAPVKKEILDPKENLINSIVKGDDSLIEKDLDLLKDEDPLSLVEGPLMEGMNRVGILFGNGELFLPQVVRSARCMRKAVDILEPRFEIGNKRAKKIAVMATVKGDVHDIGKNIVSLVLSCNDFEVIDLGVMVTPDKIYQAIKDNDADLVGLSALITPSLKEIENTLKYLEEKGCRIPVFVGGATTSEKHTAIKLANLYSGEVIYSKDASQMAGYAIKAVSNDREKFFEEIRNSYSQFDSELKKDKSVDNLSKYFNALKKTKQRKLGIKSKFFGIRVIEDYPIEDLIEKINWKMFLYSLKIPSMNDQAKETIEEAKAILYSKEFINSLKMGCKSIYGIFPCSSDRVRISVENENFYIYRDETTGKCLADYISGIDSIGLLASSSQLSEVKFEDSYKNLLSQLLYDRMVEVIAQYTNELMVKDWGVNKQTIRPAFGYPILSDQSQMEKLFKILDVENKIGMKMTSSFMMIPNASISALVFMGKDVNYFNVSDVSKAQIKMIQERKNENN